MDWFGLFYIRPGIFLQQAQEFLGRLKSMPSNHEITIFNSGVQSQADEAARLVAKGLKSKLVERTLQASRNALNRIVKAGGVVVKQTTRSATSVPIGRVIRISIFLFGSSQQGFANQAVDEARDQVMDNFSIIGVGPLVRPCVEPKINESFDLIKKRINTTQPQPITPLCNGGSGPSPETIKFQSQ